ncbi:O-antigen ligase family protein (plasmid) [Cetobacterium somerae]|uniref:O-antigen ligase family protein n=1 Tax=Cetobacterium somerae TaxID=188913 RepID=UPI003D766B71
MGLIFNIIAWHTIMIIKFFILKNLRAGIVINFVTILIIFRNNKYLKPFFKNNKTYIMYILLLIFNYNNEIPETYLYGIFNYVILVFNFYLGYVLIKSRINFQRFFNFIFYGNFLCLTISLILLNINSKLVLSMDGGVGRLSSYLGPSQWVGNIALVTSILAYRKKEKKKISKILYLFVLTVLFFVVFFSQQRSALVIFLVLNLYFNIKENILKIIPLVLILMLSVRSLNQIDYGKIQNKNIINKSIHNIQKRINAKDLLKGRDKQISRGIDGLSQKPLLGHGTGSSGLNSFGFKYVVADNNYFRILIDSGIIGFLLFMFIYLKGIFLSYKRNKTLFYILLVYGLQSLGTNVFSVYYIGDLFWLFLGIANNLKIGEKDVFKRLERKGASSNLSEKFIQNKMYNLTK